MFLSVTIRLVTSIRLQEPLDVIAFENMNFSLQEVIKIMWKFSKEIQCMKVIMEIEYGKNSLYKLYSLFR